MNAMKVVGLCMVRDEADVIALTVAHHLGLGFDSILVVDNGSSDGTDRVLEQLSRADPRVQWMRDNSEWRQAEKTTELAREAYRNGAAWVVPFDADEFWIAVDGDFSGVLSRASTDAFRVPVRNFIQRRDRRDVNGFESLLTMTRRAQPTTGSWQAARPLVEFRQIAFVEMAYPPKFVSRAAAGLEIAAGNHEVSGLGTGWEDTSELFCLHAPLRSFRALQMKAERGERMNDAGWPIGAGWHARRFSRLMQGGLLDEEWRANSYENDVLDVAGEQHPVTFDPSLRNLVVSVMALWRSKLASPTGRA